MFFWQSLIWACLPLVVKPLYLLWWSLLLIVDFYSDTSASWRVFFSWLDDVKGFFFTMERILRSSTTVVLRGRPGLFMFLNSPVRSFSLRMYQTVDLAAPNVPAISLMNLSVTPPGPHHHTERISNPGFRRGWRALYQRGRASSVSR